MFAGFLAWCARLEFLRAFEVRLRGTAMSNFSLLALHFTQGFHLMKVFFFSVLDKIWKVKS
jgi:hypothetical protein